MQKEQYTRKVKILCFIFLFVFCAVNIASNIYVISQIHNGHNPIVMLSGYQIFSLVIGIGVYIPLILAINRYAQLSQMRKTIIVSKIALCYLVIAETLMLILTIIEIIKRFL